MQQLSFYPISFNFSLRGKLGRSFLFFLFALQMLSLPPLKAQYISSRQPLFTGCVIDAASHEPLGGALLQLVSVNEGDSTILYQITADSLGRFSFHAFEYSKRIYLRTAYLGYYMKRVLINAGTMADTVRMDTIRLRPSDVVLKSALVKGHRKKFQVVGDTVVFNPQAFNLSKGARMDELMELLPGVQIRDGKYYWMGKPVQILFDGMSLFTETEKVLNNLPAEAIQNVKAYKKGDREGNGRVSDGGMVLDINVKKKWMEAWYGNARMGGGDHKKYMVDVSATHLSKKTPTTINAGVNNIGDLTTNYVYTLPSLFSNPMTRKNISVVTSYYKNNSQGTSVSLRAEGSYNYQNSSYNSGDNMQSFLTDSTSQYEASRSHNLYCRKEGRWGLSGSIYSKNRSNLFSSVYFSHNEDLTRNQFQNTTFDSDPYRFTSNPSNPEEWPLTSHYDSLRMAAINSNRNEGYGTGHSNSGTFCINYSLPLDKRNNHLTIGSNVSFSDRQERNFSRRDILYFKNNRQAQRVDRYDLTPDKRYGTVLGASWDISLPERFSSSLRYELNYVYANNRKDIYQLDRLAEDQKLGLGILPEADSLQRTYDLQNSSHTIRHDLTNTFTWSASLRLKSMDFTVQLNLSPKSEHLDVKRGAIDTTAIRHTMTFRPDFGMKLKLSKMAQLSMNYNYSTYYPDLFSTIPYIDDSTPLYILKGNPDLKPTHSHFVSMRITANMPKHEQTIYGGISYTYTPQTVGSATRYNTQTGGQVFQAENIRGGIRINQNCDYQRSLGERFTLKCSDEGNYATHYAHTSVGSDPVIHENALHDLSIRGNLTFTYSYQRLIGSLVATTKYQKLTSSLQTSLNSERTDMSIAIQGKWRAPWAELKSDITFLTRHGYSDPQMDRFRKLWNISIERKVLKDRGTLTLALSDIFHDKTNYSHEVFLNSQIDRWSEISINYLLLTFRYNLERRH